MVVVRACMLRPSTETTWAPEFLPRAVERGTAMLKGNRSPAWCGHVPKGGGQWRCVRVVVAMPHHRTRGTRIIGQLENFGVRPAVLARTRTENSRMS